MDGLHGSDPSQSTAPSPPEGLVSRAINFQPAIEAPRLEWFLERTETRHIVENDATSRPPRIVSPPDGVTVALDPDIPTLNQALIMAAKPTAPELTLHLDGRLLGPVSDHHKWLPTPGRHRLQLIGADGHVLDSVEFSVKAASP
jgi:penicillin-binding protein 1C